MDRYTRDGYRVDRAHRRFEQERARRLDPGLPHFGALQEVTRDLRRRHRAWADRLCQDFTRVCSAVGFLPGPDLRQRSLFEQVVPVLAPEGEKVAVFLVDAFRYEMATELLEELRAVAGGAVVDLKARLAELPTVTRVGMNALAPVVKDGRLTVSGPFKGFKGGELTVRTPEERTRAMGTRLGRGPAAQLRLAELCDQPEQARRVVRITPWWWCTRPTSTMPAR